MGVLRLRTDGVTYRDVAGEVVGLDTNASTYFSANLTGSLLWPLLVQGTTRAELADQLVKTFAIGPEQAASDVEDYIASLDKLGFLER